MDPALTALALVFFVASLALFAYGLRERGRERARDEQVIDLRDPVAVPAERVRQTV